jgi:large subunit ribosomal protein L17
MYHRRTRLRLNKKPDHARSLQRNLVTSLLLHETIRTTRKQAKVIQPMIDRLISDVKKKTPFNAIRSINKVVTDTNASRKLMEVLKQRYANRPSGFTRIVIAGARKGDGAAIVDLSLMDREMPVAAVAKKESATRSAGTPKKAKTPKAPKAAAKSDDSSAS